MIEIIRRSREQTILNFDAFCSDPPRLHRSAKRVARQIMRYCDPGTVHIERYENMIIVDGWRGNELHGAAYEPRKLKG